MLKRWRGIAMLACAALVAAGCGGDDDDSGASSDVSEVKIGVLDPTSGANATTGQDALWGAELATEIINGKYSDIDLPLAAEEGLPGLGGAKITLAKGDTAGEPEKGATEAERLVTDEKVVALTGAYNSSVTKTASERSERLGVPFVNGDSSSTGLTERGLKWFFRTGPHDLTFGESFFSLLKQLQGDKKQVSRVAILHTNDEFGTAGADVTEKLAQDNGFTVVKKVPYDAKSQDLSPQVQQIRGASPDVMFVLSYITDSLVLAKTLKTLQYYPKAIMGYGAGMSDPKFVQGATDKANAQSFVRRTSWSADLAENNPTAKAIAQMFEKKYNRPLTENSARTFTALMTLAQAINSAKSVEPDEIRKALKATDIPGQDLIMPWPGVKFDDSQQNEGARGVLEQYLDGRWQIVYPNEVANRNVEYPMSRVTQP